MVFEPTAWHDFFVMVGGGAATLTGLVFVAMTLNAEAIAQDAAHRYRAVGTLTGFASAFVICGLALMGGQVARAIGAEWLAVSAVAGAVYLYGYIRAVPTGGDEASIRVGRVAFGTLCCLVEMTGALLLLAGQVAGIYLAAVGLVVYIAFMITGAWLLIVWTRGENSRSQRPRD